MKSNQRARVNFCDTKKNLFTKDFQLYVFTKHFIIFSSFIPKAGFNIKKT